MISKSIMKKCSKDRHLNVFMTYDGKPHLENNITKALINTIEAMTPENRAGFLEDMVNISLPAAGELTYDYYLQTPPDEKEFDVENVPVPNRRLLAFSPTGKCWGVENVATGNRKEIEDALRNDMQFAGVEIDEDALKKEVNEVINSLQNRREHDAIPDAWIIIRRNGIPIFCIIFENKLYDLDPHQLNNHCDKVLKLNAEEIPSNTISLRKYEEITNRMSDMKEYMVSEFIGYLMLLGYAKIESVEELMEINDKELLAEYGSKYTMTIMSNISGSKVRRHKGWKTSDGTPYYVVGKSSDCYNREVAMGFNAEKRVFEMPLCFATTMTMAKKMYEQMDKFAVVLDENWKCEDSFHFHDCASNMGSTYCKDKLNDFTQYMKFWIEHTNLIEQTTKAEERLKILEIMYKSRLLSDTDYAKLCDVITADGDKKRNIVPEFVITISIKLEEAAILEEKGRLFEEIKKRVNAVYESLGLTERV